MNRAIDRLAKSALALLAMTILSACVSTDSNGYRNDPESDAANQNYQLGARYYQQGSYELARDRLERALAIDDRMVDAHSVLALTFVQLGLDRLATASFDRAIRLAPNDPDVRNSYAVYLCQQSRFDEAIVQFERAIGIVENESTYLMMTNAAVCIAKKPDLQVAEQYLRDALTVKPSHGEALIQMASLQHRNDDNLRARAFMERFLATNSSSATVLYLAVQIETQNQDDRAATDYENQLIREFPESPEARVLLQQGQSR
ncbi:MAG: type IV pilus biogenesis/stability protein PilW [Woeseia sp.]|nr:type IV pilus biogenesis/stability protein PilW [Woeseia sp.]MBT6209048.1 type IV pilus biogenesis/stability protein PilW [Woeseia sp.]